ncbi:polydiglycosylphosphate transferase PdtA [Kitasatospora kazusensis]|uniref:Polydiglycosylphosphate transferase PdtA n=1 Tax=Kitasatospora kazusensis TaxID=407974 RepID=A0ABP5M0J5_9ACTN
MTGTADRSGPDGDSYRPQHPYQQPPQPQPGYEQQQYAQQYDPYGQQQGGYQQQDAYHQDPYRQPGYEQQAYEPQPQPQPQSQPYEQQPYDAYGRPQAYVQDPYQGQQQQYPYQPQQQPYDAYGRQQAYVQDPYQAPAAPPVAVPSVVVPPAAAPPVVEPPVQRAAPPVVPVPPRPRPAEPVAVRAAAEPSEQVGGRRGPKAPPKGSEDYGTGEFTFVDEEAEESEDVIDWLKFAESRSERRDERRRKLRSRAIGGLLVLVLLAAGGGGYLWWSGKFGGAATVAAAAGKRQVNVVHLRDLQGNVSTALLVNDAPGHKGSALMLPDTLKLPGSDSGTTPLGQAMDTLGTSSTRDGLGIVLGTTVAGTWRLDTPYLKLLVAQLGGIKVDTNAEVHEGGKPDGKLLAPVGKSVTLSGQAAVLYATYQAPGEGRDAQLARFGQVLDAIVRTMPTTLADAQYDVHRMNAVLDPSLPEQALSGVLAQLAQQAKDGHFSTSTLKVQPDGTLDAAVAGQQVKDVLGGTVHSADSASKTTRVSIQNASGNDKNATAASIQVSNAGLSVVPSGAAAGATQANSEVRYTDDAKQAAAKSLATTLGLPDSAVKKVTDPQNADLVVVLGKDFSPSAGQ